MRTLFGLLMSLSLLSACGAPASDSSSDTKWAHAPAERAISTINARLAFLEQGFVSDFSNVRICVQGSDDYQGAELLLETELAYAAWLDGSGQGSDRVWQRLDFELQDRCAMADRTYSSVVIIGSPSRVTPDQEVDKYFKAPQINCRKSGVSVSCNSASTVMGVGGPGSIGYRYRNPAIWDSVSNNQPANVRLSPFVDWTSLQDELPAALQTRYRQLLAAGEQVSYSQLLTLHAALRDGKQLGGDDTVFNQLMQSFLHSSSGSSLLQSYRPRRSGFHVLLHEVGHQFGMNHAHAPDEGSLTGNTGDAALSSGQWSTQEATMAYGKPFLYLTRDDAAGIKDLALKLTSYLKTRKGT